MSILMSNVTCVTFSMQEGGILEHTNAKCHFCALQSGFDHCVT